MASILNDFIIIFIFNLFEICNKLNNELLKLDSNLHDEKTNRLYSS